MSSGRPASAEAPPTAGPLVLRPFAALRYREFRLLWLGQLAQGSAGFSERVTRSWLALELTGSAFQLGALELVRGGSQLVLGQWGGVLADRVDKRKLLIATQAWTLALYALLAWVALSGRLQLWHLYASAFGLSLSGAVSQPVRASFIPALVPEKLVLNAISLGSIATNATRMGGPLAAATLIQLTGNGGSGYVLCCGLYLLVQVSTRLIRTVDVPVEVERSMLRSFLEGWSFIGRHRPVLTQLVIGFGPLTIGFMYQAMLVVYVTGTLRQGAAAYGALYSCAGLGALVGGLIIASLPPTARGGRLLLIAGFANGGAMLGLGALGLLPEVWPLLLAAAPLLMLAGASQTSFRAANNALLLANTPRELRGRVMTLDEVFRSVGTFLAPALGALADATSPALAMATIGGGCLLLVGGVWAWQPQIRKL